MILEMLPQGFEPWLKFIYKIIINKNEKIKRKTKRIDKTISHERLQD
jgi:hypothetical protein